MRKLWLGLAAGMAWAATTASAQGIKLPFKKDTNVPPATATAKAEPSVWEQPVATVNGEPIYRMQLAEELIDTHGVHQLDTIIKRKVVEQELRRQKQEVTSQEMEAELDVTLKRMNVSRKEFSKHILVQRGITLNQYVRDTVWPAVALKKLTDPLVKVTDDDLRKGFEANFGDKVEGRMLVVKEMRKAQVIWKEMSEIENVEQRIERFEETVKKFSIDEATRPYAGRCMVNRHIAFPDLEKAAFRLDVGELSEIIQVPDGNLIFICAQRIPAEKDKTLDSFVNEQTKETIRDWLTQDIFEKKQRQEISQFFLKTFNTSKIVNFLTNDFGPEDIQPTSATVPASDPKK